MKKIFYFIASAIVALGAVACQNDINENIAPESEGLSFTAEVEMTRITIGTFEEGNGYPVVWENGDKLEVTYDENDAPVTFTFTFDGEKFVCEETGVNNLVGKTVSVNYFASSHGIDSTKGKAGMFLASSKVTFENGMTIDLSVQNSFLRFSSTDDVTLTLSDGAYFVVDNAEVQSITLTGNDVWVAFNYGMGAPYTLSASIDDVTVKQTTDFTPQYGKIYNLGDIEKPAKFYVVNNGNWSSLHLYAWDAGDNKILGAWPGTAMTQEGTSNRYYVEIPAEYVGKTFNYIVNGGGNQTGDLTVDNFTDGYTYEIPGVADPKPETVSIYLKTTWGWTDWSLWAWNSSGDWYKSWPGQTMEYTQEIGGVTYKAWDVPADKVGKAGTQIIVSGKEDGGNKQTKDTPIDVSKDVFVELNGWDSSAGKGILTVLTSPY